MELEQTLKKYFGFDTLREGQREVIEHLLAGRSAAAIFPTGGGKSLCYQLPALLLPGITLVVSPLIALMKDQIDQLLAKGIAAARLDSSLNAPAYKAVIDGMHSGSLKLLYVAPERFNNELFRATLSRVSIALFAVDEAHCISEWGHNFRPDYLKLTTYVKTFNVQRVLALTATATPKVQQDICTRFNIESQALICTGFYRPNLTLLTHATDEASRDQQLVALIRDRPSGPSIVYVTLQRTAVELATILCAQGIEARAYHAGMDDAIRSGVQDWFMHSTQGCVVATIAFGMGIDKANIRYVYHYNLPKSLENYAQEIGRAGRDGLPSTGEMFVCSADLNVLENFIYGDTPTVTAIYALIEYLAGEQDQFEVSLISLANQFDIRLLVLRTLLTYLELGGWIESGTPVYSTYQFKEITSVDAIIEQFSGERGTFLSALFRCARKARIWWHIDLNAAVQQLPSSRERIVKALDYLDQRGLLAVKPSGLRLRYRVTQRIVDPKILAEQLIDNVNQRERNELQRLQQVLDFVSIDACQVNFLSAYFDKPLATDCGHCSYCLQQTVTSFEKSVAIIDESIWADLLHLRQQKASVLTEARLFARFCCGVTSPALTKAKLSSHALFGVLAEIPFTQILAKADNI